MEQVEEPEIAKSLVKRIAEGDQVAERLLVERYQRGLKFVLMRSCNQDNALADDIGQETWRIVIEKVRQNKIKEPHRISRYIVQTGKNLVISHFRKSENKVATVVLDDAENNEPIIQNDLNPEEMLHRYKLSLLVKKMVLELEQCRDKELFYRLYLLEQDKVDICCSLKLESVHFDRVLYRAKQRFRKMFQNNLDTS